MSELLLALADLWGKQIRDAKCVHHFDDGGQEAKGGEGTSRVKWCEIRNVVEDTAKDMVVGQLEQRRCAVYQECASDIRPDVVVEPSVVCAKCKASCEHESAERVKRGDSPRSVSDTLPDMGDGGDKEPRCEHGRYGLDGRIEVKTTVDWFTVCCHDGCVCVEC